MIDYLPSFTNTNNVAFPFTLTVNASGPSATDGTELIKLFGDDIWGRAQAIMDYAGLTPDGVTEAPDTAQIIEALQKGFGAPPGVETGWNLAADPGTTGHRALLLQGQGILHANFLDLTAAVYVGDGNNAAVAAGGGKFYKALAADGLTADIAGTFLILPDYRGVVERGLDPAASIDPDGASRFLGDIQVDAGQGHFHALNGNTPLAGAGLRFNETFDGAVDAGRALVVNGFVETMTTDGVNGTPRISSETRMHNRSVKKVIWF